MKDYANMNPAEKDRLLNRFLDLADRRVPDDAISVVIIADRFSDEVSFAHSGDVLEVVERLRDLANALEKQVVESN